MDAVPKNVVARLCIQYGPQLHLSGTHDEEGQPLDGQSLLWALAGNESSFGANCGPRYEPAYGTGKYSHDQIQAELNFKHGRDGASSIGPWQTMAVHGYRMGFTPQELRESAEKCVRVAVKFLNGVILDGQKARTLEEIADAYNSGNFKDKIVPTEYINRLNHNYYNEILAE